MVAFTRRVAALAPVLLLACNTPEPKASPQPAATSEASATTSASAAPSTSSSSAVVEAADAGSVSSATTDAGPALLSTAGWASLSNAKKTLSLRYPADVFPKNKIGDDSIALISNLTRGLLGETKGEHRYQIRVEHIVGTPFDAVKRSFKTYPFPDMFPKGTEASFTAVEGAGDRANVAGHTGYRVHTGVEGYNQDTTFLDVGPKKTLRFQCTWIGSVMGPEIDADKQVAICDAVLASLFAP
jgi:hypothetical protein